MNPTRKILGTMLPAIVPPKANFVFMIENLGCARIDVNPFVHGGPVHCQKRLSSPLWVSSVESPVSPDHSFTVFDPSNNVEFLVDTGSSISLLPVKNFAS